MCTPLRAAQCLVAFDSQGFRCLGNVYAAEGCALSCCLRLPSIFVFLAMCAPLRATTALVALDCPGIPVSWQCVRRQGRPLYRKSGYSDEAIRAFGLDPEPPVGAPLLGAAAVGADSPGSR